MNKKTYPYHLTAAEESVLEILWNSKDPLTGQQIIEEAKKDESNSWQERSIFLFLNSLMDKKFIESVGFVRAGKPMQEPSSRYCPAPSSTHSW